MSVDLRTCKPGDKLRSKHGIILTYIKLDESHELWPHRVKYPDEAPFVPDSQGWRTHDGYVMSNPKSRLESDHDIIQIIPS